MSESAVSIKDDLLNIEVIHTDQPMTAIVRLTGDLDLESFPMLKETLEKLEESKSTRLVINLSRVRVISSSAVGALMNHFRELKNQKGMMFLVSLAPTVIQVLELLHLRHFFPIAETEKIALEQLANLANNTEA